MIEQIHCNFKGTNAFIRQREVLNLGLLIIWKHHLIGIKQYTYATYHVVRKVHKGITETDCEGSSVILKIHEKKENLGHSPFFRIPYSAPSMGFSLFLILANIHTLLKNLKGGSNMSTNKKHKIFYINNSKRARNDKT